MSASAHRDVLSDHIWLQRPLGHRRQDFHCPLPLGSCPLPLGSCHWAVSFTGSTRCCCCFHQLVLLLCASTTCRSPAAPAVSETQ